MSTAKAPTLPASIFRAYDIRGVVGDTLTAETAYWIGRAIGSESLAAANRASLSAAMAACPVPSWSSS